MVQSQIAHICFQPLRSLSDGHLRKIRGALAITSTVFVNILILTIPTQTRRSVPTRHSTPRTIFHLGQCSLSGQPNLLSSPRQPSRHLQEQLYPLLCL